MKFQIGPRNSMVVAHVSALSGETKVMTSSGAFQRLTHSGHLDHPAVFA